MVICKAYRKVVGILLFGCVAECSTLTELPIFLKAFWKSPAVVGAMFPCSDLVGQELTKYMVKSTKRDPARPLRILEVGAGTGSMTSVIVNQLRDIDHLDAVEISPDMCTTLHKQFGQYAHVSIHCMSILDFKPDYFYDYVICTLPFNSFDYELMCMIIDHIKLLIKPEGIFSFVAYAGVAKIKEPFLWGKKKENHKKKMAVLNHLRELFEIDEATIIRNIPPINIYHLQICA